MTLPKKIAFGLAALFLLTGLAQPAAAAEPVYCFSRADFAREPETLTGVCITALPEGGQLLLGRRIIRAGDVLTAGQLEQMVYLPAGSSSGQEAAVGYLPIFTDRVAEETTIAISVFGKRNAPPVAEDQAVETYKNLPSEGLLRVSDPEEQELVFTVTRQPRRGSVIIRPDGSYLYTPEKNKVGTDSFCYTASDPAGNVSREATVTVRILKPTDELQYRDTDGLSCRFEAEWLRQTGIFSGESVSGQLCFSPEEPVTRGQLLAMLMETLGLPSDRNTEGLSGDIPFWLRPYLVAALRSGLITGAEDGADFRSGDPITGDEAGTMIRDILSFALPSALDSEGLLAAWAGEAVPTAETLVLPEGEAALTRAEAAFLLYRLSRLKTGLTGLRLLFPH